MIPPRTDSICLLTNDADYRPRVSTRKTHRIVQYCMAPQQLALVEAVVIGSGDDRWHLEMSAMTAVAMEIACT